MKILRLKNDECCIENDAFSEMISFLASAESITEATGSRGGHTIGSSQSIGCGEK